MTISTLDGLVAALATADRPPFYKTAVAATAGQIMSLWAQAGHPGAGATPPTGAGEAPTKATAGALHWTNPAGGALAYLARLGLLSAAPGVVTLYDRLVHTSGLDANVTTSQTVNSTAISRPDANGGDVECFLEIYTQVGATQRTINVTYTDQDGNTGNTGVASIGGGTGNFARAQQLIPVQLAAGDSGVRSVQSVQLQTGGTGTVGNFGITLARRIANIPLASGENGQVYDPFAVGLPQVYSDACLALMVFAGATSQGPTYGSLAIAKG